MIPQETKDQIEKGIWTELDKYFGHQSEQQFERNAAFQIALSLATEYAEKLEEKDKAYNELGVKFDKEVERWQERDANEFEKRRVLEVELAQLKEIAKKMEDGLQYIQWWIEASNKDNNINFDFDRINDPRTAYAEWFWKKDLL